MPDQVFRLVDTWNGGTKVRRVEFTGTENECIKWIHDTHSFSYHAALHGQGYVLEPVESEPSDDA